MRITPVVSRPRSAPLPATAFPALPETDNPGTKARWYEIRDVARASPGALCDHGDRRPGAIGFIGLSNTEVGSSMAEPTARLTPI